ncbi:MAG: beta-N-acetylhexosaminidase [Acidobacteria bacterium 13_1_20CM_4_56_7]|nr:MAG: beta-N-acetylhexosaminidase [Acidobacteria bacterium 13_1_20CM_4_56_7]
MRMLYMVAIIVTLAVSLTTDAQEINSLHLMPWPASVKTTPNSPPLLIQPSFTVGLHDSSDRHLRQAVEIFLSDLRRHTGSTPLDFSVSNGNDVSAAKLAVSSDHPTKEVQELGEDESYTLEVTASGAQLRGTTTLGVMRGLQTFLQLVEVTPQGFAVPTVVIQDKPRFPWRGLMIDAGRHFMPVEVIERNLDGMAAVKMNVFHWHLSENQGFRVESKRFPKLQEMGSDGLFYTQEQVREVIAYAHDRGIRVIPEFDMPGHSTTWFVGYPDLASAPGPYAIERKWGVFDPAMDPTRESTYKFLDQFIGEMAQLFPDQFFHIGGDEVNGKQWNANPKIQEFMRAHNLKSNADLQAYFNTRIQKIVAKHGKTMEGWDEILRPDLPKSIVIQSWRGQQSLADAARQGYRGLLSSGYYLDLMGTAASHYTVDPFADGAANLSDEEKQKILGGEACMWAEYVSPENMDSRIWPRAAAIAERLWSPENVKDVNSMYARMDYTGKWLDAYGLTHNTNYVSMLQRMTGNSDISGLRTLADVVEPVKGYAREQLAPSEPTSLTPLNRVIDAARPESATARQFNELVNNFLTGQIKPGMELQIRSTLNSWRDNETQLSAAAQSSSLVQEVAPLSHDLSMLGAAGLQALDYLDRGEKAPEAWKAQELSVAQSAIKPRAQLLLMVASPVQKLIQASAGEKPTDLPFPKNASD